jgi:hypothetical protein
MKINPYLCGSILFRTAVYYPQHPQRRIQVKHLPRRGVCPLIFSMKSQTVIFQDSKARWFLLLLLNSALLSKSSHGQYINK